MPAAHVRRLRHSARRLGTSLVLIGALGALACAGGGDAAADADRPAGDTGRVAAPGAVDTAGDSVTTGAALRSTDRPIQPPPDTRRDSTRR